MIAIIDYGLGNLRSVEKAFEYLGFKAFITDDKDEILNADKVVLPGVGAISDAMKRLKSKDIDVTIEKTIRQNKPFLGICLGMQLLFEKSYEGGSLEGLHILNGNVLRLPINCGLKVPHIGWNILNFSDDPLFFGLKDVAYTYFVHSFYVPAPIEETIASTVYGVELTAAVRKNRVYGVQFHPEKSGETGLKILRNFGEMN